MKRKEMQQNADRAVSLLKALASRNRLMILCSLVEGECSVGGLAEELGLRHTVVSQHLGLLRRDELVQSRRHGQTIYYALAGNEARRVIATLYNIYCADNAGAKRREDRHEE